jgi:DNA-binding GntR family transcriptional regulator
VSAGRRNDARAAAVLAEVARYVAAHRVPPTLEEVAHALGCSVPVVHGYVSRLEREGVVESLWVAGRRSPRSLRITESRQLVISVVVGNG